MGLRSSHIWRCLIQRRWLSHKQQLYNDVPLRTESRDIRLLRFTSDDIRPGRALRCTFQVISLGAKIRQADESQSLTGLRPPPSHEDQPHSDVEYSAISYAWGDKAETASIIVNEHSINVPPNTEAAVRHLLTAKLKERRTLSESSRSAPAAPLLWIDALCIDQQDITEKNSQVAMMGDIFSYAQEVLVWLGDDDSGGVSQTMMLLADIYKDCGRATDSTIDLQITPYHDGGRGVRGFKIRQILSAPSPLYDHIIDHADFTTENWVLLTKFLSLRWFSRVWIIQEILLAKSATLYWGKSSISWEIVLMAVRWLLYGGHSQASIDDPDFQRTIARCMQAMQHAGSLSAMEPGDRWNVLRDSVQPQGEGVTDHSLAWLLNQTQLFDTTCPEDRVYAILGLLSPENLKEARDCARLTPDYALGVDTIYTEATRAALVTSKSAACLKLAGLYGSPRVECSALPSWVPAYGQRRDGSLGSTVPIKDSFGSAAFAVPLTVGKMVPLSRVLNIRAYLVDTVSAVGPAMPDAQLSDESATQEQVFSDSINAIQRAWAFAREHCPLNWSPTIAALIADVLCCGRTSDDRLAQGEGFLEQFEPMINSLRSYTPGAIIPFWFLPTIMAVLKHSANRPIFATSGGRIGMGPSGTQRGDRIVLLFGHSWPFVLRPVKDHWLLIGDTYVAGLTDGAFIRDLFESGSLEQGAQWIDIH